MKVNAMNRWIVPLPPNRVRRRYTGGAQIEAMEGAAEPADSDRPEDWIASTVRATNIGMPIIEDEGLSLVENDDGTTVLLSDLLASDPGHFLGITNDEMPGPGLGFLVKFLDAGMRSLLQVHPTRQFARDVLGVPFGKLECYVVLNHRPGIDPAIWLGFQHPPTPEEFERVVIEQDIPAIDAWFEDVPVKPGETWLVPGGFPHAIGDGILMIEVMEPSDLCIRFEFERDGIVIPEDARFMGQDVAFATRMIDFSPLTFEEVTERFRLEPVPGRRSANFVEEILVDGRHTDCFTVARWTVRRQSRVAMDERPAVLVITGGSGRIDAEGSGESSDVRRGSKAFVAASTAALSFLPEGPEPIVGIVVRPRIPGGE
jgi:mannose-6-phosphate isomerase